MFVLNKVRDVLFSNADIVLDIQDLNAVNDCYLFLESFAKEKVIYGINTGFGPMAQWRVDDRFLKDLQYNIIRSHFYLVTR